MASEITYLQVQAELGGYEVVLKEPFKPAKTVRADNHQPQQPVPPQPQSVRAENILPQKPQPQQDSLWQSSGNLKDFYEALQKHSIYTKSMRSLSFSTPKETKTNAKYLLLFHSPQELTSESKNVLERLFKKLGVDLNDCAISFFFKCNAVAMPREKLVLKEMLQKEIGFLAPEKIIFFRESPKSELTEPQTKIDGKPITFAGKPAITLYSLLEMLPKDANYKEKMLETWNTHLPNSGWFSS